jgi:hypothetical protein
VGDDGLEHNADSSGNTETGVDSAARNDTQSSGPPIAEVLMAIGRMSAAERRAILDALAGDQ